MLAVIFVVIALLTAAATALLAWPRASDNIRKAAGSTDDNSFGTSAAAAAMPETNSAPIAKN